ARLHLLPTIWFRNTWSWAKEAIKPKLAKGSNGRPGTVINIDHPVYGRRYLYLENKPSVLFTENETNRRRLYDAPGPVFCKDGINDFVVNGRFDAVNPESQGTKAAPDYRFTVAPGETVTVKLRLTDQKWPTAQDPLHGEFDRMFLTRKLEGDPAGPTPPDERKNGRNRDWPHLYNSDVISMPDKWEYPWYAAWDLAFHCVPLALVDP